MKTLALLIPLLLASAAVQAADAPATTETCAACHGTDGVAVKPATPHLNGQLKTYLVDTMVRLQKGRRATDVAQHIPAGWTPEAIDEVAAYYAGIRAQRPRQTTDAAAVQRGNQIYFSRCVDCHADSGRIGGDESPIMNAQNLEHMITQGKAYLSGQRKFVDPLMRDAYRGLSAEDIESVAHYLASLEQYPNEGKKKRRR